MKCLATGVMNPCKMFLIVQVEAALCNISSRVPEQSLCNVLCCRILEVRAQCDWLCRPRYQCAKCLTAGPRSRHLMCLMV